MEWFKEGFSRRYMMECDEEGRVIAGGDEPERNCFYFRWCQVIVKLLSLKI